MAIAAALVHRPPLLLLDEPTSQLDPVAGDELIWMLRRLNEEWGTAVVIAEHRIERCLPAADRVVAMQDGAVACDAPPGEFLAWSAAHAEALDDSGGAPLLARATGAAAHVGEGRSSPAARRRSDPGRALAGAC